MGWFDDIVDDVFDGGDRLSDIGNAVKGYFTGETASTINTAASLRTMAQQNEYNTALQNDAQYFNAAEAQKARDFEKKMSNTAYQRVVKDLRAAGLNPLLAATSLGGASTPSGQAATSPAASVTGGSPGGAQPGSLAGVLSSASSLAGGLGSIAKLGGELTNQVLSNNLLKVQTAKVVQDTLKAKAETDSIDPVARRAKDKFGKDTLSQMGATIFGLGNSLIHSIDSVVKSAKKPDIQQVRDSSDDFVNSAGGFANKVQKELRDVESAEPYEGHDRYLIPGNRPHKILPIFHRIH